MQATVRTLAVKHAVFDILKHDVSLSSWKASLAMQAVFNLRQLKY